MSLSEVMTIIIAFHGSGYKTFKEFLTLGEVTGISFIEQGRGLPGMRQKECPEAWKPMTEGRV